MTTVTQADRDAAHAIMSWERGYTVDLPYAEHPMAQAFARHREEAELRGVAMGIEAAAKAARLELDAWQVKVQGYREAGNYGPYVGGPETISAIRALAPAAIIRTKAD